MSQFAFERFGAYGWVIHKKMLAVGESFLTTVGPNYSIENASDIGLWTKGLVQVVNTRTGKALPSKVPGDSILKKLEYEQGEFMCTALEPSEFWCINRKINRKLFEAWGVSLIDIPEGDAKVVPSLAVICDGVFRTEIGTYSGPAALRPGWNVQAVTRVLGFQFHPRDHV